MLKNNFLTLVIVLILLAAGGIFMYGSNFKNFLKVGVSISPNPPQTQTTKTDEFVIIGSSFKFTPDIISANKGDKIRILFKDTDGPHNITFPDFNISTKTLGPNQQETIEFTADKTGTFPFYDSYAHHKEFGMLGKLIIK